MRTVLRLMPIMALAMLSLSSSSARSEEPFYKDKQIHLVTSAGVGGGFAIYARLMAKYMSAHIAGDPVVIVESMPGAGGLLATNYLYARAPHDGTYIGLVHTSVPFAPLFGTKGARYDPLKFQWLGALDHTDGPCLTWHTSPVQTWQDLLTKQFVVGSAGAGSPMDIYPAMLNKLFGTHIKVIAGYKGGADIFLAMERGEVEGRCGTASALSAIHPTWIPEHKVGAAVIVGDERNPDFPNAPALMQLIKDDRVRSQVQLIVAAQDIDRPVLVPPDAPEARVKELRDAFNATMTDPMFVSDINKAHLTLNWVDSAGVVKVISRAYAMPPDVVAAAKQIMGSK